MTTEAFLAEMEEKYGAGYREMKYTEGDRKSFQEAMIRRLKDFGQAPEFPPED